MLTTLAIGHAPTHNAAALPDMSNRTPRRWNVASSPQTLLPLSESRNPALPTFNKTMPEKGDSPVKVVRRFTRTA